MVKVIRVGKIQELKGHKSSDISGSYRVIDLSHAGAKTRPCFRDKQTRSVFRKPDGVTLERH